MSGTGSGTPVDSIVIIVETGEIVDGANSYNSLQDIRDYCAVRGLTLPVDDTVLTATALLAMCYVESFGERFKGHKTASDNPLQFPRNLMKIDGYVIGVDVIPPLLKKAQCRATYEITAGADLQPIIEGIAIQEDTVGPLTTKYQDFLQTLDGKRIYQTIDTFLQPLLIPNSGYRLGRNGY